MIGVDNSLPVLGQAEILAALRKNGVTNAEISRALGLPSSRVTELMKGDRLLKLAEAVKLVDQFKLEFRPLPDVPSADVLLPLLDAMLLRSERSRETEASIQVLAEALEYGLGLIARNPAIRSNPAALATAAQAAADRLAAPRPGA